MISAGIDVGTRFVKACIVKDEALLGCAIEDVSRDIDRVIGRVYQKALDKAGISKRHVKRLVSTGYGAKLVKGKSFSMSCTHCVAKAAFVLDPEVRTVLDCGGLFITITSIDERGVFERTLSNDKCAAGSGKFLEMSAQAIEIPFSSISQYAERSKEPYLVSSNCAVFAESEVITQVNYGRENTDIIAGVLKSIAGRAATLFERIQAQDKVALAGGLATVTAFSSMFEQMTDRKTVSLPIPPQNLGAFGAGLMAQQGKPSRGGV
ncbi:MAG: hypothetical protein JEZ02_17895 [Desulfatibacillum sp.]|nr:hypothetical protein [Desulfatibacillum sp.]